MPYTYDPHKFAGVIPYGYPLSYKGAADVLTAGVAITAATGVHAVYGMAKRAHQEITNPSLQPSRPQEKEKMPGYLRGDSDYEPKTWAAVSQEANQLMIQTDKKISMRTGRSVTVSDFHAWNIYFKDYRQIWEKLLNPYCNVVGHVTRGDSWLAKSGQQMTYFVDTDTWADHDDYMRLTGAFQKAPVPSVVTNMQPGVGWDATNGNSLNNSWLDDAVYDDGKLYYHTLEHRMLIKNTSTNTCFLELKQWLCKRVGQAANSVQTMNDNELTRDATNSTVAVAVAGLDMWGCQANNYAPSINTLERPVGLKNSPIYDWWNLQKKSRFILPPGAYIEYTWQNPTKFMRRSLLQGYQIMAAKYLPGQSQCISATIKGQFVTANATSANAPGTGMPTYLKGELSSGSVNLQMSQESHVVCYGSRKMHNPQAQHIFSNKNHVTDPPTEDNTLVYWPALGAGDQTHLNPATNTALNYASNAL